MHKTTEQRRRYEKALTEYNAARAALQEAAKAHEEASRRYLDAGDELMRARRAWEGGV